MLIVCPSCANSYDIEAASQQPDGRQVRCVRCRTVWRALPSRAERLMAAAEAIAPATQLAETAAPVADKFAVADVAMADNEIPAEAVDAPAPEFAAAEAESVADATAAVEAPPRVPVDLDRGGPVAVEAEHHDEPAPEPVGDIETYAARHDERRSRFSLHWPLPNMQTGILALLIVDAILIGWRSDFVRVFPQTASFYATLGLPVNLRSVTFEDVATSTEQNEGVPILVVQGNIVNRGHRIVDVSRLKFVVRNAAKEEIYSWTAVPPRPSLPGGEAVGFRSRLASPPPYGRDVLVRFVTRHGSEAVDVLTREEGRFDLLLTDIRMPIMDGIALALAVARDFPTVTMLLMTGYADQRERAAGLDALIHDVITKPFTLATLRATVHEALTVKARS